MWRDLFFKESMQVIFQSYVKDFFLINFMKNYLCMFKEFYLKAYPHIKKSLRYTCIHVFFLNFHAP